jgi:hypothetical protein
VTIRSGGIGYFYPRTSCESPGYSETNNLRLALRYGASDQSIELDDIVIESRRVSIDLCRDRSDFDDNKQSKTLRSVLHPQPLLLKTVWLWSISNPGPKERILNLLVCRNLIIIRCILIGVTPTIFLTCRRAQDAYDFRRILWISVARPVSKVRSRVARERNYGSRDTRSSAEVSTAVLERSTGMPSIIG